MMGLLGMCIAIEGSLVDQFTRHTVECRVGGETEGRD